ncbi:MAG: DNA/RNA nuclease SfsA [Myxococcota bacterium]|nr:DNA/RNA nuclease SfsA [Myxococcota bacterium]
MLIKNPLHEVTLIRRYKRFLADVRFPTGEIITVHCPNSGSMRGCANEGARAWVSDSENAKRKLRFTLEFIEVEKALICVNTQRPNGLVEESITNHKIPELDGYEDLRREVRYGVENSRIDILLTGQQGRCFVEVKNVTMKAMDKLAAFPDAVTTRGTKHIRELMQVVADGHRGVLVFCVGRTDAEAMKPADDIDPVYGQTLRAAYRSGVEILAYRCSFDLPSLTLETRIPFLLDDA